MPLALSQKATRYRKILSQSLCNRLGIALTNITSLKLLLRQRRNWLAVLQCTMMA